MKRRIAVILCLLLLLSLSGCVTVHHGALALYGESPVVSVELYDLPLAGARELAELLADPEAAAPLKELRADETDEFLAEVRTLRYADTLILLPVAQDPWMWFEGFAVKVTYENGNWEMFDEAYCACFDGERVHSQEGGTDSARWDELLRHWFGVESKYGRRIDAG